MGFERRFVRERGFGTVVAVSLPEGDDFELPEALVADETAFAYRLAPARRRTWAGGRLALRAALAAQGCDARPAILATARGAPAVPEGFSGSISHKAVVAVALAMRLEPGARATVGIDVEIPRPLRHDIGRHVLTPAEQAALASLPADARDPELLRRFSAKEAIYKALDPWVGRFVSFREVDLITDAGGRLEARLALSRGEGPFTVELDDASDAELVLIAARVTPG